MLIHAKFRELTWWIWLALAIMLSIGICGSLAARQFALMLAFAQDTAYLLINRSLAHFPTQVRVAYFAWMAVSFVPKMDFMHLAQTAGTAALVLTGYCPLARMLLVFPWNRSRPLTWRGLMIIAFHPPVLGSVKTGLPV